jgi:hypothetical protein
MTPESTCQRCPGKESVSDVLALHLRPSRSPAHFVAVAVAVAVAVNDHVKLYPIISSETWH